MDTDIDFLWALVSGALTLLMAIGIGVVIEGLSRRRSVSTGAGRHLATTAGAVAGAVTSMLWFSETVFGEATDESHLWLVMSSSVLLATVVSGGVVERATFAAHGVIGVVVGAVVVPGVEWAQRSDGILNSIAVEGQPFTGAAAATVFAVSGWMALVGIMVIGPRQGRLSADGSVRSVPGKSMPAAALGALIVLATSTGLAGRPDSVWDDALLEAAPLLALSATAGAAVAVAVGWQQLGASSTLSLVHGAISGVVASLGAPLELTVLRAVVVGAVGSLLAVLAIGFLERAKIDDPVGVVGAFGVAGVWGTIAAATSGSAVIAQLAGTMILAAWAIVVAGVLFGGLRVVRLLRVSLDVEVVGLEN